MEKKAGNCAGSRAWELAVSTEHGTFHAFRRTWCRFGRLGQGQAEGKRWWWKWGQSFNLLSLRSAVVPIWAQCWNNYQVCVHSLEEEVARIIGNFEDSGSWRGLKSREFPSARAHLRDPCVGTCSGVGPGPPVSSHPGSAEAIRFPRVPKFLDLPLLPPQGSPVPPSQVKPPGRLPSATWEVSCPFYARPIWEADPCNLAGHSRARARVAPSCQAAGGLFLPYRCKSSRAFLVFNCSLMSDSLQRQGL